MVNYSSIVSLAPEGFEAQIPREADLNDESKFTKVTDDDIARIEGLLQVLEGTLTDREMYLGHHICQCGRLLTMYDFIWSALDAGHDPSLVLHTLVGSKYISNPPRRVRCSDSGHYTPDGLRYSMRRYNCNPSVA